jgi:hypothetical protein
MDPPTHSSSANAEWAATDVLKRWTFQALQVAKDEVATAYESVLQDLEGLSTCGGDRDSAPEHEQLASDSDDDARLALGVEEEESMRVSDLIAPEPLRSERTHEEELRPPPQIDDGFELIDFEDEARVIALR